jgi:(p)ppGpp synthase/HD superfamily hydrolase
MEHISATPLSSRFTEAFEYARLIHTETRKGTSVPYMAHLLGTAALVLGENGYLSFPVTEDMVIAALLHDAAEDKGGEERLGDIRERFGRDVERIVRGCSDALVPENEQKPEWKIRKEQYIRDLAHHEADVQLVSAADKLYNARAILEDYRLIGESLWPRFKRGRKEQLWYFRSLVQAFRESGTNRVVEELARTVDLINNLSRNTDSEAQ